MGGWGDWAVDVSGVGSKVSLVTSKVFGSQLFVLQFRIFGIWCPFVLRCQSFISVIGKRKQSITST